MHHLNAKEKLKITKILSVVIPVVVAVVIVSLTVGRELFEGRNQSMYSFALIHFSGYLFFLLMPVEMAFIYYLQYFQEIPLIAVALGTAVTAQIIDYLIGLLVGSKSIFRLVGQKRILNAENYIQKYGNITIFIFNLLPLSSPLIALVAGMLKLKFKNLIFYSISGLVIKYIIISFLF